MKEYRIRAKFNGSVYGDRTFKRMVFDDLRKAKIWLAKAQQYYSSVAYAKYLDTVVIEQREVSEWESI